MTDNTQVEERLTGAALTEQLWQELSKLGGGEVRTENMSSEWLTSIRARVLNGELPAFLETDYRRGWELYARGNIAARFIRHRQKMKGFQVRRFFPVMSEVFKSGDWADGEEIDEQEMAIRHAEHRMEQHINSAVTLHGAALVARGAATFEDVRRMGRSHVDSSVATLREQFRPEEGAAD